PVLRLEEDVDALWNEVSDEGWDADAQVDQHAIPQFAGDALGDDGLRVHGSALHNEIVDQGSGRDDVVGRDNADWYDIVGRDEDRVSRHGHQRVEVPSREGVGEIAKVVAEERVHEREVGPQRGLKQIRSAVDLDRAFAVLNHGADPGWREHPTE